MSRAVWALDLTEVEPGVRLARGSNASSSSLDVGAEGVPMERGAEAQKVLDVVEEHSAIRRGRGREVGQEGSRDGWRGIGWNHGGKEEEVDSGSFSRS